MPINALDLVLTEQWAMRQEALERMLEAAARQTSFDPEHLPAWCTWAERAEEHAIQLQTGARLDGSKRAIIRDGVALVPVFGPIFRRANMMTELSGATSLDLLARDIAAAVSSPEVKAILLDIDSPGGQAAGISELAGHIAKMGQKKPICAYIGGTGASAAYWLAAACQGIAAAPTAIVGSIGTMAGFAKSDGSEIQIVSSQSPRKNRDPETEDGRADIIQTLDALTSVFVGDVARFRGVSEATVLSDFGQGGVLVGRNAQRAGMIDRISSLEATIRSLAKDPQNLKRGCRAEGEGEVLMFDGPLGTLHMDNEMEDTTSGAALAAKPFEEELTALLAGVRGSIDRARDIHARRAEEGRSLSVARREQLLAVRDELTTLLEETTPRASEAERLRLAAAAQAFEADRLLAGIAGG